MQRLLQFTLDLFDPPPTPAAFPAAQTSAAAPVAAAAPAESLEAVLAPATFSHPRGNREALLGDSVVRYEFKRGRRRTIGFVVGPDGLAVSAPKWVPLYEVESALREKAGWILKKLDESRERRERAAANQIEWKDGAAIPFLGEQVIVALGPHHGSDTVGAVLRSNDGAANLTLAAVPPLTLHLGLPHTAQPAQIREAVQAWLMGRARGIFIERLDHFAPELGVQWRKLSLSNAGTRWGSASATGSIRLNWRLVHFRLPIIDYVVAHELSHLRFMDHSSRFWDTVRTAVPDYAELRAQLKNETLPTW